MILPHPPDSLGSSKRKRTKDLKVQQQHFLLIKLLSILITKDQISVNFQIYAKRLFHHPLYPRPLPRGNIFNSCKSFSPGHFSCLHFQIYVRTKGMYLGWGRSLHY